MKKYFLLWVAGWFSLSGMDLKEQPKDDEPITVERLKNHFEDVIPLKKFGHIMKSEKNLYDEKNMKSLFSEKNVNPLLWKMLEFQVHQCQVMIDEVMKNVAFSFFIADFQNNLLNYSTANESFIKNLVHLLCVDLVDAPVRLQNQQNESKKIQMITMNSRSNIKKLTEDNNKKTAKMFYDNYSADNKKEKDYIARLVEACDETLFINDPGNTPKNLKIYRKCENDQLFLFSEYLSNVAFKVRSLDQAMLSMERDGQTRDRNRFWIEVNVTNKDDKEELLAAINNEDFPKTYNKTADLLFHKLTEEEKTQRREDILKKQQEEAQKKAAALDNNNNNNAVIKNDSMNNTILGKDTKKKSSFWDNRMSHFKNNKWPYGGVLALVVVGSIAVKKVYFKPKEVK